MSYYETNLGAPNNYWRVTSKFDVFEYVGFLPSNHYYGATQLMSPVLTRLTVRRGGRILNLCGGLYYADKPGAVCRRVVLHADDKSPFEKRYSPDFHTWPMNKLAPCATVPYVAKAV